MCNMGPRLHVAFHSHQCCLPSCKTRFYATELGCSTIRVPPLPLQAREIRDAHTKITSLERGMVQMAADFEQEKAALETGLRAQLADAVTEQNSLRRWLAGWQRTGI